MANLRIYHHYADCEEFHPDGGMWRIVAGPESAARYSNVAQLMLFGGDSCQRQLSA